MSSLLIVSSAGSHRLLMMASTGMAMSLAIAAFADEQTAHDRSRADALDLIGGAVQGDFDRSMLAVMHAVPRSAPPLVAAPLRPRELRAPNPPRRAAWHVLLRGFS